MTAQTQPEALRRVQAYIARLKQSQRIDRECISVFDGGAPSEVSLLTSDIEWMPSRIAELEAKASENYWLLYAMKEQELWYQDELVEEAKRTAAEKLRADQMTEQHRMEAAMNAEARGELAQLREKLQSLSDEQIDAALQAWFGNVLGNSAGYRCRMRGAIEAAHNITGEPA